MAPTVSRKNPSFPILNVVNHSTKKDLPFNQANYNWSWLPISETSIVESHRGLEMQWSTMPKPAKGSGKASYDSLESDTVVVSPIILTSSTGAMSSQNVSKGESFELRPTIYPSAMHHHHSDVINTSYICNRLGLSKSIFSSEDPVKLDLQESSDIACPSVATSSFIYSHDTKVEMAPTVSGIHHVDGFETIDLTNDLEGRFCMTQHQVVCDHTSPDEPRVVANDYQMVSIPPPSSNQRKERILLAIVITSVVVVVIVIIVTVLLTHWLSS